jgi:hypothetical protein
VRLTRECLEAGDVLNRLTVLGDGALDATSRG